ncbi:hypothetical protein CHS0354_010511, partial [Potamilus streckersoni]
MDVNTAEQRNRMAPIWIPVIEVIPAPAMGTIKALGQKQATNWSWLAQTKGITLLLV